MTSEIKASPAEERATFSADITPRSSGRALREYGSRLRSGDPGALPAVAGLIVLCLVFSQVSSRFFTRGNIGNLPGQGAFIAVIALGLVFVLLLGEIDLSAGTTGGMAAAFAAQAVFSHGLHRGVSGTLYFLLLALMVGAVALALWVRLWTAAGVVIVAIAIPLVGLDKHVVPAIVFGIGVGVAVGLYTGVLVAKIGIPSFVVTLALYLAWEGVLLFVLGSQPVSVSRYSFWNGLANYNLSPAWGWVFYAVTVGGYFVVTFVRAERRRAAGLSSDLRSLVVLRSAAIAVLAGVVVLLANQNRNPNPGRAIEGIPWAAAVPLTLMIFWTLALTKTTWGRHLFATGGSAEAARRAGIDVDRIKISAFAICSGMAALGGVFLSSNTGGVQLDLGQGNTLLFAVAAAVIGGTSLFGGRGKPRDAIIGALVIAIIPNGIGLRPSLPPAYNEVITGVVLMVAAGVDALSRRRAKAR